MANKSVFAPTSGKRPARAETVNCEGAPAYAYDGAHALAQLAVTGTFNTGFYGSGEMQTAAIIDAAHAVDPVFLAQTAIYSRAQGHMKDAPALLLAILSMRNSELFARTFDRVIQNGKLLRTFVQLMRSGVTGRKSLGSAPKRCLSNWLNTASDWQLLSASVGNDPSLADVIKMVHPKPACLEREALFAWLMDKPCHVDKLPVAVQALIRFKAEANEPLPDVPFALLTALPLTARHWATIAERGSWQQVRMNLNTFARQGVFDVPGMTNMVAGKLSDKNLIRQAKAMPYQLLTAANNLSPQVPSSIREALVDAMEIAVANAPGVFKDIIVCPDVSASMMWPVTGHRKGATTATRCIDVAALIAAALLRANRAATVMPFDTKVHNVRLSGKHTVLTNARRLASFGGGGTHCASPLVQMNRQRSAPDLVVIISDNQSWLGVGDGRSTPMMIEWERIKRRNVEAKLVCIDIAAYGTTQAPSREDVLNVGGFSDAIFEVIARFAKGENGTAYWTREITKIEI